MHASYFYLYLSILIYPILLRTKEDTWLYFLEKLSIYREKCYILDSPIRILG